MMGLALRYDNAEELIQKGIVRSFVEKGEEILEAVIYKGYYKTDKFVLMHVLKRNNEKKCLELIRPLICRVVELNNKESYIPMNISETKKIYRELFSGLGKGN